MAENTNPKLTGSKLVAIAFDLMGTGCEVNGNRYFWMGLWNDKDVIFEKSVKLLR